MKLLLDTQDIELNHKVQKHDNCNLLCWTQQVPFPLGGPVQYVLFSYCLLLFFSLLHICYLEQYKWCFRPLSWTSLYMWKGDFSWLCQIHFFKSGHLSKKWLVCVIFVALSVLFFFPMARAPPVLFQPHYSLQLDQIFGFCSVLLEICVHQTNIPMKPQDRYLKLFKPFAESLCSFLL